MSISVWSILVVILMLGVLVTIHELGHFWMANILKIKAYEVSIFIGPKLFSWKKNGVDYSIRCLPFGAYVRFSDFDEEGNVIQSDDPELLLNQPRWKRLLVALAGPFMNMFLGVLIFIALFSFTGYTSLNIAPTFEGTQLYGLEYNVEDRIVKINGDRVWTYLDFYYEIDNGVSDLEDMTLTLKSAETGELYDIVLKPDISTRPMLGVTHTADITNKYNGWEIVSVNENQNNGSPILKAGDYLTHVDGKSVADEDFDEFFAGLNQGDVMHLTYIRNGVEYEDDCVKTMITIANDRGVRVISYDINSVSDFFTACRYAALMPLTISNVSIKSIGDVFEGEEEVYNMVSGPVGVTSVVSDVVDDVDETASYKFQSIVLLAGFISIGLMFTNMLPIPGLDGVQVIYLIVEMIIGRALPKKAENIINGIGFVLLLGLVIFAFASDIIRIIVG